MSTLSQELVTVNPPVAAVDLVIAAADFAAFCAALRSQFPAWGRSVQIVRKATYGGPVARVVGLRGHTFSAADVVAIRAIAAEYPAVPAAPLAVSWPQRSSKLPAMKFGRSTTWAGVR